MSEGHPTHDQGQDGERASLHGGKTRRSRGDGGRAVADSRGVRRLPLPFGSVGGGVASRVHRPKGLP